MRVYEAVEAADRTWISPKLPLSSDIMNIAGTLSCESWKLSRISLEVDT